MYLCDVKNYFELLALSYYTILSQIPLHGVGSYEKREQTNKKLSNAMRPK